MRLWQGASAGLGCGHCRAGEASGSLAHHSRPIRSAHEIRTYAGCDDRLLGPQRALIDRRIVLSEVPLPDFFSMRKGLLESNLGLTQLVCAVETLIDAP